jgi:hypothetical protein
MNDAREVLARFFAGEDWTGDEPWDYLSDDAREGYRKSADAILAALAEAGMAVVPREPIHTASKPGGILQQLLTVLRQCRDPRLVIEERADGFRVVSLTVTDMAALFAELEGARDGG